jgi:DNA-binding NtrC family response regulator
MARVLVIDDDLQLRKLLCKILKKNQNYEVHDAENGEEGLEIIRTMSIDLVVTDIFMPGEDGIGTIMEICDNFPEVKIIAISGGGNVKDVDFLQLASCLGAQKIFQKPFDTKVFLSTVHEILH